MSERRRWLSADEMIDRIQDGYYEDVPPEARPGWYVRGRARLKRRVERASQDKRSPSPDTK